MYLTSSYKKKKLVAEKTLSMGVGCDKLFEAVPPWWMVPIQVYEIEIEK